MKGLTVQQPYAWAIAAAGKDVENRVTAWKHRGPLAIHAASRIAHHGMTDPVVLGAAAERRRDSRAQSILSGRNAQFTLARSAIVGVVDVVDVHKAVEGCCESPWAQYSDGDPRHVHMVLANARDLVVPVDCSGALGLWDVPEDVEAAVMAQVG